MCMYGNHQPHLAINLQLYSIGAVHRDKLDDFIRIIRISDGLTVYRVFALVCIMQCSQSQPANLD